MTRDSFPDFESFAQLPDRGEQVFLISGRSVHFVARIESGLLEGWSVFTGDPGYEGFLRAGRSSEWTETGPEPVRTYMYEQRTEPGGPFFNSAPADVTATEFRRIYFGEDD